MRRVRRFSDRVAPVEFAISGVGSSGILTREDVAMMRRNEVNAFSSAKRSCAPDPGAELKRLFF